MSLEPEPAAAAWMVDIQSFLMDRVNPATMADGNSQPEELKTEVKQLSHRMYQVEDVLKALQAELCELKEQAGPDELSSQ